MRVSDVVIVLSRPSKAGNVGAVCRAMKNMGLSRLRLVAPEFETPANSAPANSAPASSAPASSAPANSAPANSTPAAAAPANPAVPALSEAGLDYGGNLAVIQARAVHARDVWERAETFDTLAAAVKDCALVIGTTRRRGRYRKQVTMTPEETAVFLKSRPGPAALVFGNERTGLEDGELELCNLASHIPVNEAFPSLNLSHAVQVYAYELFLALGGPAEARGGNLSARGSPSVARGGLPLPGDPAPLGGIIPSGFTPPDFTPPGDPAPPDAVKGQWVSLDQAAIEAVVTDIIENFAMLGFYKQAGREEQEIFFRDILSRAGVTEREGRYFAGLIARAAQLARKAGGA